MEPWKQALPELREPGGDSPEQRLWAVLIACQGKTYDTASGLPFSYAIRRRKDGQYSGELLVSRKEDSKTLAKSSIFLAYQKVRQQTQGDTPPCFKGPKAIGQIFGISYGNTA